MPNDDCLWFDMTLPMRGCNGGLFISQGQGIHSERVLTSHELIFVRRGCLGIQEEDQVFEVKAGETLLLAQGRRHKGTTPFPNDLEFYWIHFETSPSAHPGSDKVMQVRQHIKLANPDVLSELFHRFLNDQEIGCLAEESASLLVMLMLCEVAYSDLRASASGRSNKSDATLAHRAHAYIQVHYRELISTSSIAHVLDCSPDYLTRIFRNTYGVTPTTAIHQRRLRKARTLLIDGAMTVEQISHACGFEDTKYFRRLFRRYEGMTPLAYRHLHSRMHVMTV